MREALSRLPPLGTVGGPARAPPCGPAADLSDPVAEGNALVNVDAIHLAVGRADTAQDSLQPAPTIFREVSDRPRDHLRQCLDTFAELGDRQGVGMALGSRGEVYLRWVAIHRREARQRWADAQAIDAGLNVPEAIEIGRRLTALDDEQDAERDRR